MDFRQQPYNPYNVCRIVWHELSAKVLDNNRSADLLKSLHWLPIPHSITYKIALLTFKAINNAKPTYLYNLLNSYQPTRNLHSSKTNLLVIPDIRTVIGRRSFSYAAPFVWNNLPINLRSTNCLSTFRSQLKTHLFPP